ncbi:ubiquitin carboxyl-terminal hydrolase, putative [Medicago truncatula]|uniref:Ubiquitin carboxyl-terminal hydrolase, putative n=1 Tax=Medicago truncatula TaxID=3880 RepID=G7KD35_MEDTR|nr:ubiquitin carboxyl-terminal hydrolase, putative [Medicago truncatula]
MARELVDERSTSFAAHKRRKTTDSGPQPENATIVDSQPGKDPSPFKFTWRIERFSWRNEIKLCSDVFDVGGYKWHVIIFPEGDNAMDHLSMYFGVADSENLPNGWSIYAQFTMSLVNQINAEDSVTKDLRHRFNEQECDWGEPSFIPLDELSDPSRGYVVNNTLVVEVEVTRNVDEKDIADHVRERLKKDQKVQKHKNKENTEAHLYTIIRVVRDEDLAQQIGKDIYFDLVDPDKVSSFRVPKNTTFKDFKKLLAKEFDIPAGFQRFWYWARSQNHTYRPIRPMRQTEEARSVGQIVLFLEVERGPDLRPMAPVPVTMRKHDILLFFKLYDPEKEELRYVGRLFVNCYSNPSAILARINKLAGYDLDEEIELYEEIEFEPNVKCDPVDKKLTFTESKLNNGAIICFQKASAVDNEKHFRYPDVPSYMKYVHNRQVPICLSDIEPKDEESLEEKNENIISEETNVDKNIEAQQSKGENEGTSKSNTSKLVSIDSEEFDAMVDEDVIAAIDRVLSEGITLSLKSQHSVQGREYSKRDPNLPEQLLQELRDIAFKGDLVEKLKEGLTSKVNFNAVKEKIDANADAFSSLQLEQVGAVVNLLNNIVRMLEKIENLKKERNIAKKSTDQDSEALKETRQKILNSMTSFTNDQTELNSLDAQIAKLQEDRAKIAEIQDQEKDKITSLNKDVKSIFQHLVDDQIKLKSVGRSNSGNSI